VRDGTFEFVVTDVSCGHSAVDWGILHESADGQYCLVDIEVTNIGNLPRALVDIDQYLVTAAGSRHRADGTAGFIANGTLAIWEDVVLPDHETSGVLVFDVPADAAPAAVELHDSRFSDGTLVTLPTLTR
jgi:hypothetical protein